MTNHREEWTQEATRQLVGKTIKSVRYMTEEETEAYGWYKAALIIRFTDGSYLIPSADDEGNDAGSLFTSDQQMDVLPSIRL